MLFMVIEWFRNRDPKPIYCRLRDQGRQMPDGLKLEAYDRLIPGSGALSGARKAAVLFTGIHRQPGVSRYSFASVKIS